jgi:hypothetical protein
MGNYEGREEKVIVVRLRRIVEQHRLVCLPGGISDYFQHVL